MEECDFLRPHHGQYRGAYRTSLGNIVALDWEQPPVEEIEIREEITFIPCICGSHRVFNFVHSIHAAWVLAKCVKCNSRCYFSTSNRGVKCKNCAQTTRATFEIVKIVCGRGSCIPEQWVIDEDQWQKVTQECKSRFGWKLKKR